MEAKVLAIGLVLIAFLVVEAGLIQALVSIIKALLT